MSLGAGPTRRTPGRSGIRTIARDSTGGPSSGGGSPAAGEVDMAIGGDQGGSIRIPSSWCGILGLKPT
jgi:Asp-tRNA(Asn)/Glu-tRNA(Gln) amidotransferase A subunit family amidase